MFYLINVMDIHDLCYMYIKLMKPMPNCMTSCACDLDSRPCSAVELLRWARAPVRNIIQRGCRSRKTAGRSKTKAASRYINAKSLRRLMQPLDVILSCESVSSCCTVFLIGPSVISVNAF